MSSELKKAVCGAVFNGGGSSCWLVKSCCYCRSVSISSAGTASSFLSSSLCPTPPSWSTVRSSGDGWDVMTGTKPRIRSDCNQAGFYYWGICLCVVGLKWKLWGSDGLQTNLVVLWTVERGGETWDLDVTGPLNIRLQWGGSKPLTPPTQCECSDYRLWNKMLSLYHTEDYTVWPSVCLRVTVCYCVRVCVCV